MADLAPATIGFRLNEQSRRILHERAMEEGVSPHVLAKSYVLQVLREPADREGLINAAAFLCAEIIKVREEIATTAKALLIKAGHVDEEEVEKWIVENYDKHA